MKRIIPLLVLFLLLPNITNGQSEPTQIIWDEWGVPHIYAEDTESLMLAFGWAQAHNHADLILRLYGEARGRASEYWGIDYRESDIKMRRLGIMSEAQRNYDRLPAVWQSYVTAFASGINQYATENPDAISDDIVVVLPVSPVDVVAHGIRVLRYEFVARTGVNYGLNWDEDTSVSVPPTHQYGSNGWAVAPERSASGNALLLANPHQPWEGFGQWMEAHLNLPDMNLYGGALIGQPVIGVGFNDYLGWTHTVNTHDGWDIYRLQLMGEGYLLDGEYHDFVTQRETMLVKQADGTLISEDLLLRHSEHGAVLSYGRTSAIALRVVAENATDATMQWWEMGRATSLEDFETALRQLKIPMFNVIYADRDGNILYLHNEQVPIRATGDWDDWIGVTNVGGEIAIIDGTDSSFIWDYTYHAYEELPRLINPATGFVQNANEPAWTATIPSLFALDEFPDYMLPDPYTFPRPSSSFQLITSDDDISFDELRAFKFDTYVELADQVLDDLITIAQESDVPIVQEAVEILGAWDRRSDADSIGAVLFIFWAAQMAEKYSIALYDIPFDLNDPLNTPRGLSATVHEDALSILEASATQLEVLRLVARDIGGGIDLAHGDIFRLRYMDSAYDIPANGTFDFAGSFSAVNYLQDNDNRFRPVLGDSFIALVEFSNPIYAEVLLTHGNATQPTSPHVGDQLPLFAEKQMRIALFTREQVEAHAVKVDIIER